MTEITIKSSLEGMDEAVETLSRYARAVGLGEAAEAGETVGQVLEYLGGADEVGLEGKNAFVQLAAVTAGIVCAVLLTEAAVPVIAVAAAATADYLTGIGIEASATAITNVATAIAAKGLSNVSNYVKEHVDTDLGILLQNLSQGQAGANPVGAPSPVDQTNWGNGQADVDNLYDYSGNITGSEATTYGTVSGLNAAFTNFYNAANGPNVSGTITGSSVDVYDPSTGVDTTTSYTGANGQGAVTRVDVENPDGTSQITTYDGAGNTVVATYTGPNGTGTGSATVTLADGQGDYLVVGLSQTSFDLGIARSGFESVGYGLGEMTIVSGMEDGQSWGGGAGLAPLFGAGPFRVVNGIGYYDVLANYPGSGQFSEVLPVAISTEFGYDDANGQVHYVNVSTTVNLTATGVLYTPAAVQVTVNGQALPGNGFIQLYGHVGNVFSEVVDFANVATGALTDNLNVVWDVARIMSKSRLANHRALC